MAGAGAVCSKCLSPLSEPPLIAETQGPHECSLLGNQSECLLSDRDHSTANTGKQITCFCCGGPWENNCAFSGRCAGRLVDSDVAAKAMMTQDMQKALNVTPRCNAWEQCSSCVLCQKHREAQQRFEKYRAIIKGENNEQQPIVFNVCVCNARYDGNEAEYAKCIQSKLALWSMWRPKQNRREGGTPQQLTKLANYFRRHVVGEGESKQTLVCVRVCHHAHARTHADTQQHCARLSS